MKKFALPLVVLGAVSVPALAQSNVTISGFVAGGYESYRLTGQSNESRISDESSRIIFSGTEDLGGGLKAFFQIDSRFRLDNPATSFVGDGNTGVGLQGAFGKVTLGRWDMHYNEGESLEKGRALADQALVTHSLLGQVNGTKIAFVSRANNQVRYDSPSFSGFNATVAYSTNPAGDEGSGAANGSKDGAYQLAARYVNGPINSGVSYWNYNVEGAAALAADQRAVRGWFGYTFPFGLKLGLVVDQSKLRNTTSGVFQKRTGWALPVSYAFGSNAVYFSYARVGNTSGTTNSSANQWVLGYDYALSKRTAVGANYTRLTNNASASYDFKSAPSLSLTSNGQDARQFFFGIKHSY